MRRRARTRAVLRLAIACVLAAGAATGDAPAEVGDSRVEGVDPPSEIGRIEVLISELESDEGFVRVALLDSKKGYEDEDTAFRQSGARITGGRASVRFDDVPYGTYAVKVFHDENENEKLDTNFVGLPKEGFGFSNNAMGRFGPPDFDAAKFDLKQSQLVLEIRARSL